MIASIMPAPWAVPDIGHIDGIASIMSLHPGTTCSIVHQCESHTGILWCDPTDLGFAQK